MEQAPVRSVTSTVGIQSPSRTASLACVPVRYVTTIHFILHTPSGATAQPPCVVPTRSRATQTPYITSVSRATHRDASMQTLNEESPADMIYSVVSSFAYRELSSRPASNISQVLSTHSTTNISVASITVQSKTTGTPRPRGTSHESAQQTGTQFLRTHRLDTEALSPHRIFSGTQLRSSRARERTDSRLVLRGNG